MFSIFIGSQIGLFRDRASMFFIAIFPTLLVLILGTMLASLDNPDTVIESMEIAYYVNSDDAEIEATVEAIIGEFDDIEQVRFVACTDLAEAKSQLEQGNITSLVVFNEPFAIEIHDGLKPIENKAVHSIFTSISRIHGCALTVMNAAVADFMAAMSSSSSALPPSGFAQDGSALPPSASNLPPGGSAASFDPSIPDIQIPDISTLLDGSRVEEKDYGVSRTMMDYYAITMIVMMFFMGSFFGGAMVFYEGRKDGTLRRLLASPLSRTSIYLQHMVSQVPLNLVQILIIMLISSTFFGAHYAATWQLNLFLFVVLFFTGLACSSVALLIGIFIRVNPTLLLMPVIWPVLFLCGTFQSDISIPGVSEHLPPTIIQQAAFDLTLFGETSRCVTVLLVSVVVIIVATAIGSVIFNKREVAS